MLIYLFSALIAESGARQVLGLTLGAKHGYGLFISRMTAFGTKPGIWRQVFPAVDALTKDKLLMPAMGTES